MKSTIKVVPLASLHHNPHRMMGQYPINEKKVAVLQKSIDDVGFWESVIAREHPDGAGYQIAFGHHRIEAAKCNGLKEVPVILRKLNDEQMLKFMGRENGEDYTSEFLIQLNTWNAAINFTRDRVKAIDTARLLGWTDTFERDNRIDEKMNRTAEACNVAHAIIVGGYMTREDLEHLSVSAARDICGRAHTRMEQLAKMAKKTDRPDKEVEAAKKQIGKGAKLTAKKVKAGTVASKDIRGQVDADAFGVAKKSKVKAVPLFEAFAKSLGDNIQKMLYTDASADRLHNMVDSLSVLTMSEDVQAVERINFELTQLEARIQAWRKALVVNKVSNLSEATKQLEVK